MTKKEFPYARTYRNRRGTQRWRYRRKGVEKELGREYGSEEFRRRYAAAEALFTHPHTDHSTSGTFEDLWQKFCRLHFPGLAPSTRKDYRAVIEPLRRKHGHKRVAKMARGNVLEIKTEMADTPQQANKTLKRLSQMMDLAVQLEWRLDNPVRGVKRFPTSPDGFYSWAEQDTPGSMRSTRWGRLPTGR